MSAGARLVILAAAALAALAFAGCGPKHDVLGPTTPERLTLVLDRPPSADHVGLFAARDRGEFRRAGLDVSLVTPGAPSAALDALLAGRADLAITSEPELLLARDRGARLVSVGAIVQRPLSSIMALGRRVRRPADLAGRRVGTSGLASQEALAQTLQRHAGRPAASVRLVDVGFDFNGAMRSHLVDATLGGFWNVDAVALELARQHPLVIPLDDAGVPTYDELVIVARQDDLYRSGNVVRRFMAALGRGQALAAADPAASVTELRRASPGLDPRATLASVKLTLPTFRPPAGKPFGYQDGARWDAFNRWLRANRLVRLSLLGEDATTNEFLPGQGL